MNLERSAEEIVKQIIEQVQNTVKAEAETRPVAASNSPIFEDMNDAIEAASSAQRKFRQYTMEDRRQIIESIRTEMRKHVEVMAREGRDETGMGRFDHKVLKHHLVLDKTPGIEDLRAEVETGDGGMTLYELSPFGVIGSITPSTNPTETIICNAIGMIAAGNSVVFSPHPSAKNISKFTVEMINKAIVSAGGPAHMVVTVHNPTLDTTDIMLNHPKVNMLCTTGGPGIVVKTMSCGKKAIGAGAGNPPVVVDETADILHAGKSIIDGCGFDNNLPCIAEKEVLAVASIADALKDAMRSNGGYEVTDQCVIDQLVKLVLTEKLTINKDYVGKDASYIMSKLGIDIGESKVVFMEVGLDHPFVVEELMMPILPVVRVSDVDTAIALAVEVEHGNRHTAMMHSKNINNLTKMARAIQTTIFVKNGPSYSGIGFGAEGHTTFTIAGPTGEGLTSAKSFARRRRCVLSESLFIK